MKKVCLFAIVLAMVFSMSIAVSANPGEFVASPSGNQAPTLIKGDNESENCEVVLTVTSYANRASLTPEAKQAIEAAYDQIAHTNDLSTLNAALAALAAQLNVSVSDLAVSDLFDISSSDCDGHDTHAEFDITLKAETLNNFVCLLHYIDGAWVIVEDARVTQNGEHLEFTVDSFSPFAIVVNTAAVEDETDGDETTDATDTEAPADDKKDLMEYVSTGANVVMAVAAVTVAGSVIAYLKFRKEDDGDDDYYD